MNIPRSKKGAHEHTHKCGLSVQAKRLHTLGETTLGPGETTPGEQDIGRNDRNSHLPSQLNFNLLYHFNSTRLDLIRLDDTQAWSSKLYPTPI